MVADTWATQSLHEFGTRMGITRFHANDHGVACVHITGVGSLFIEPDGDAVRVYLARDFARLTVQELEHLLALVYPLEGQSMPVWCGLKKETQVVFGVTIAKGEFDSSGLETVVALLRGLLDRVRPR
ncbi:MAG: CesT family type III secretion system chaperone [Candidatus Hydrogenedentes bacterium]|nr:CesT family type III secretion system chaperone [Candidatus Hydrogenedentota bacterium]